MQSNLVDQIIAQTAARHPDKIALLHRGNGAQFRPTTYRELLASVNRAAHALSILGIARGDRVAILAENGPYWVIADLAVLSLGAVVVPLYQMLPPSAIRHILNDSGCRLIFVGTAADAATIEDLRADVPGIQHVIPLCAGDGRRAANGRSLQALIDAAPGTRDGLELPTSLAPTGEEIATIVYTSGTTAEPKGVALSHRNIASNVLAAIPRFNISTDDVFLSFLPLCHMFERTCGYYTMLAGGATIAYATDLTTIAADIKTVRPTIIIAVPRIIEKVYEAVAARVAASSGLRRRLVGTTIHVLNDYTNRVYRGQPIPLGLRWRRALLDRFVAAKFREISGGRLRMLVSGGAPLDRRLAKTLWVLGFKILEGYGLTEAAPLVAASAVDDNRLGTVGRPFHGVEVAIGAGQEILVRGPNVMVGYYRRPEETRKAIDKDGWLHTGDQGRFDDGGNLVITGRLKELIVTSYGKNVSPVHIEAALLDSRYLQEAMVCGDHRKFVTALLVPARSAVEVYAREHGLATSDYAELLRTREIAGLLTTEVRRAMESFADYERVKKFAILSEGFSVENGLLTPTQKMRRARIAERYRAEIAALYGGDQGGDG